MEQCCCWTRAVDALNKSNFSVRYFSNRQEALDYIPKYIA